MQQYWRRKPKTRIYIDFSLEVGAWTRVAEGDVKVASQMKNKITDVWKVDEKFLLLPENHSEFVSTYVKRLQSFIDSFRKS